MACVLPPPLAPSASINDPRPDNRVAHIPRFARAHIPLPPILSPNTRPPQVVDDEALEELLKEVGRALVEADVNVKVMDDSRVGVLFLYFLGGGGGGGRER